jgi:prepilin-type processing-associated H-X9-DG protein/prepilin-type N-terminal cleavage/methylation domain-containing protein
MMKSVIHCEAGSELLCKSRDQRGVLSFSGPNQGLKARRCAFTLIELLAVFAIIAIVSAILLPALAKAKSRALANQCVCNMKQLQLSWEMYCGDNNGKLPPNGYPGFGSGVITNSWITGNAQLGTTPVNIEAGLLYQYGKLAKIYACPANRLRLPIMPADVKWWSSHGRADVVVGALEPQTRTVSMMIDCGGFNRSTQPGDVISVQGASFHTLANVSQIKNPPPVRKIVFVDENEYSVDDGCFSIPPAGSGINEWWSLPGSRHNNGCTFSFADGHAELWKWHGTAVLNFPPNYQTADNSDDLSRVQAGMVLNGS